MSKIKQLWGKLFHKHCWHVDSTERRWIITNHFGEQETLWKTRRRCCGCLKQEFRGYEVQQEGKYLWEVIEDAIPEPPRPAGPMIQGIGLAGDPIPWPPMDDPDPLDA